MKPSTEKRTQALKALMGPTHLALEPKIMSEDKTPQESKFVACNTILDQQNANTEQMLKAQMLLKRLIEKEISKLAQQLGIEAEELQAWIDLQIKAPEKCVLRLLRVAQKMGLDPLMEEISSMQYEDNHWDIYVSVDAWIRLLNQHESFNGISFGQSETLIDGIPEWMECAIYRKDRIQPLIVREYFQEVKRNQENWKNMPRRMLRHRALQQGARLALGGAESMWLGSYFNQSSSDTSSED
jgi:RecT family